MSDEVWKFPLLINADVVRIAMPRGAAVLTVRMQGGSPMIWALVAPEAPVADRWFRVAGTGHPITEDIKEYIGTYQLFGSSLIFHVFEIQP